MTAPGAMFVPLIDWPMAAEAATAVSTAVRARLVVAPVPPIVTAPVPVPLPVAFAIGDLVETVGYAEMAEFRPSFNAIEATKLQPGPLPEPVPLDLTNSRNS